MTGWPVFLAPYGNADALAVARDRIRKSRTFFESPQSDDNDDTLRTVWVSLRKTALITGGNSRLGLEGRGASRIDDSSYITGTELFVDGGFAQI